SIAGSIGIISVCLVLALSSGFNNYIKRTEEDMLSYYPVEVTESAFDLTSAMMSFTAPKDMPDMDQLGDKVYVDSFLTTLGSNIAVKNNITPEYIDYVEGMDAEWYSEIQYGYGVSYSDNLFTSVKTGITEDAIVQKNMSLSALKEFYISELMTYAADKYGGLIRFADFFGNIVNKMPGTESSSERFGEYVQSQYDVIAGQFPKKGNANEAVIVVGNNNDVTDLTLAQLGLLDEPKFLSLFDLGKDQESSAIEKEKEKDYLTVSFEEILNQKYVLYFNDEVYRNASAGEYPYEYVGTRDSLTATEEEGIELKVVGILRLKPTLTYGCLTAGLNITEQVVKDYIDRNMDTEIVEYMQRNSYSANGNTIYYNPPAKNLASYYSQPLDMPTEFGPVQVMAAIDHAPLRHVGGLNTANSIKIYATDFDGKDALLDYLDAWNDACESNGTLNGQQLSPADKITYTDRVGLLMGMMQTMLDVITIVLVAFTAISLVVSSVMIGIITYVSVVERIKEIGVLRSLGARKQDIRNLFNAETFIIGLAAGLFGIIVTYLLSIGVNAIIFSLTSIGGICALPPLTAFIMVCVSVVLTLISGLIPAQSAAKKDPVIALRTE
ncbi:MAG: ABC transporter permease, partial [Clostridia bacterium]|nr:ABC transporter permease [Clostridia bacterium]